MEQSTMETILGSHNSMSYLPPLRWWGWLLTPFARCQNKTIDGQLAAGAQCFDLRVSFDRHGMAHFRHVARRVRRQFLGLLRVFQVGQLELRRSGDD